jgi:hypothetical protein
MSDVWLERDLRVGMHSAGERVAVTSADARRMAHEIERILCNPDHYRELARAVVSAADDAEALSGVDFT